MMLRSSRFLLDQLLPPHVLVLRVRRSQIAIAKPLPRRKVARPVPVTFQICLKPPLGIRRRPRTPAAEILFKLNFQRADVPLDLSEFFVNSRHDFSIREAAQFTKRKPSHSPRWANSQPPLSPA